MEKVGVQYDAENGGRDSHRQYRIATITPSIAYESDEGDDEQHQPERRLDDLGDQIEERLQTVCDEEDDLNHIEEKTGAAEA